MNEASPLRADSDPSAPDFSFAERLGTHLADLRTYVDLNLGQLLRGRESSSDVVQSTVRQLLSAAGKFEFRGDAQFRAYICSAALNKILEKQRHYTAQRRDIRRLHAHGPDAEALLEAAASASREDSPSAVAEQRDDQDRLRAAFDALDEEDRRILAMKCIFNLSVDDIAAAFGIAKRTVNYRVGAAKARLASAMGHRPGPPRSPE